MIIGIHHVAIGVPDFERGLAFYRDALGFEVVERTAWNGDNPTADAAIGLPGSAAKMAMLKAGNAFIEMWQYSEPAPRDLTSKPSDLGYPHFCLQVDGIEDEYARLQALGMTFVGPPVNFGTISAIYGTDPFGNTIELYEIRDPERPQLPRS